MACGGNIRRFRCHIPLPRHLRDHGRDRGDDGGGDGHAHRAHAHAHRVHAHVRHHLRRDDGAHDDVPLRRDDDDPLPPPFRRFFQILSTESSRQM